MTIFFKFLIAQLEYVNIYDWTMLSTDLLDVKAL